MAISCIDIYLWLFQQINELLYFTLIFMTVFICGICILHSKTMWLQYHPHGYLRYSRFVCYILKLFGLDSMLFGYLRCLHSVFCTLKLFDLDSMLFGYLRYLHCVLIIKQ